MSAQVEQQVIGGLLIRNDALPDLELYPDDFAVDIHARAYRAILDITNAGQVADIVTVCERLRQEGCDGVFQGDPIAYLGDLVNNTASAHGIRSHAELVRQSAQNRRAYGIMTDGAEAVRERGVEAVDEVVGRLMQLHNGRGVRERLLQDAVVDAINKLERIQKQGESSGLTTGLGLLDDRLGGFQDGELYIIGARPSMGKTAMMLCSAIRAGVSVGVFSGEQPAIQLGQRAISAIGRVDSRAIRRAEMNENDWKRAVETMTTLASQAPVVIDDTPSPTADYVLRRSRQWQRKYGVKAIFVDYIQRMTGNNKRENRQSQVEEITRMLKTTAGELSIPVIALSQVNRSVESRPDKRPQVSDLRDSGAIEAEADTIMLLYRDEVYNEETSEPGVCEVNVAKQRNGPTGRIKVAWLKELMVFENLYPI